MKRLYENLFGMFAILVVIPICLIVYMVFVPFLFLHAYAMGRTHPVPPALTAARGRRVQH